jgi:hypothetical protein
METTTVGVFKEWSKQVVQLQLSRADRANWELRGPGFWKLDQANWEATRQKSSGTDHVE